MARAADVKSSDQTPDEAWDTLSGREVPDWFHDAKLGIFLHWGLYSVPAWAPRVEHINAIIAKSGVRGLYGANPYSEWYRNSYRVPGSPSAQHHLATYGDRDYYEFAGDFDRAASAADTDHLAALLRDAGAEYVVLTSKHHDGFTLWPSQVEHPRGTQRYADRDLVGDLTESVRGAGMRMGLYYSGGYDWSVHDVIMKRNADAMLALPAEAAYEQYATAHVRELIERYRPSVLWNDIGWPGGGDLPALFRAYYEQVPDGVINDRWAEGPAQRGRFAAFVTKLVGAATEIFWPLMPPAFKQVGFPAARHSDFTTPEYRTFDEVQAEKWEQTRGVGHSFALNRNERAEDMIDVADLVRGFVDVVSKNGNLLLGVGPDADGTIPVEQQRVLDALGAWMAVNGTAIKGTRPWRIAEGRTDRGTSLRFTRSNAVLHAFLMDQTPPAGRHVIEQIAVSDERVAVELLGVGPVAHSVVDGKLAVEVPDALADAPVHTLRITGVR
ncbi:alpha-L-fucosidase [Microbacterium sp. A196]|uniref:alpha-L-fucosidase n=1 Tax=Microbacterium sp. A196 TaxID=3457320 RepID=UPI003FCF9D5A